MKTITTHSFDAYLLQQAVGIGAQHRAEKVTTVGRQPEGRLYLETNGQQRRIYDLVAIATGINFPGPKLLEGCVAGYKEPGNTKTYISEACFFGRDMVKQYLGNSMHVFLLDVPRLEFAAVIPKGEYATVCLLGENIDREMINRFMNADEVQSCFPPGWQQQKDYCHCSPRISIRPAQHPFSDGIVFVGDCGTTRLYKDGIGAAYRTAKAAAATAVFHGIAERDFRQHYWPVCQAIASDNNIGKLVFVVTRLIQKSAILRRGMCRMVAAEQRNGGASRRMSSILWNTFTGSAPYREIFRNALHPAFLMRFAWNILAANLRASRRSS